MLQELKILPEATISSILIAGLGALFGIVYFYEGLTLYWVHVIFESLMPSKNKSNVRRVFVHGTSMEPCIHNNTWIKIKMSKPERYHVGDIIMFRDKGLLRTLLGRRHIHRIIQIDNLIFTAKGDNRIRSAPYETQVPIKNIIAKIDVI
ncbi:MAG: S26 family signal peptidase [Candidatus Micrarchaeaceae archaeon]